MLLKRIANKIDAVVEEFGVDMKANSLTRIGLLFDIFLSHVRYGTNVEDYFLYQFYNRKHRVRKDYVSSWDRSYMMNYANSPKYFELFEDKRRFVETYGKYMKRSLFTFADGEEAYHRWLEENPADRYIFKPAGGCCGVGIFVLPKDSDKIRDYAWLAEQAEDMVAEPFIENCEEVKKIYPGTLNTLRVPTMRKNGKPEIFCAYLRMGVAGIETDNYSNGGIAAPVDLESGVIYSCAMNRKGKRFVFHPDSVEQLVGFKIPMWEEVKALVLEVADITPEVVYSAWDIAVLPTGPVLVEGNICGDVAGMQQIHGGMRVHYAPYLPKKRKLHFGYNAVGKPMREYYAAKEAAKTDE